MPPAGWTSFHRRLNTLFLSHLSLASSAHRPFSSRSSKPFFISTPIFYVNSEPHIGHLHSLLVADVLTRYQSLLHPDQVPLFSTGTDEHGLKIQRAASSSHTPAKEFCDVISQSFVDLARKFDCNYTKFIRTTDEEHFEVVREVWRRLDQSGHIYKAKYEGWYCVSDESFVANYEEKLLDGHMRKVSPESGHPVEWRCEENYMFKLSLFRDRLTQWLSSNEDAVKPSKFNNYLKSLLHNFEWADLSISRPADRLTWGIPVPNDESHTIYVWLDALVNYLTVVDYPSGSKMSYWPPDVQVIGKDIIKFHAIYWPSFLLALGLPLPRKLLIHSHWTIDSIKMSKSLGNVVKPLDLREDFTTDGVRYYLMRASNLTDDANFSRKMMHRTVNSELADTLGNLLSRTCAPSVNRQQVYPAYEADVEIENSQLMEQVEASIRKLPHTVASAYESAQFNLVADEAMHLLRLANSLFHQQAPWKTIKDPTLHAGVDRTIFTCLEALRVSSILLSPIVPTVSTVILDKLNVPSAERTWRHACDQFDCDRPSRPLAGSDAIVYSRVRLDQ